MNNKLLKYLALPAMLLMSACSTLNSKSVQDPFAEQLSYNYKNLGDSLGNTFEIKNKRHFMAKAKTVLRRGHVAPYGISRVAIHTGDDRGGLRNARETLMTALKERTMNPKRLADMQFYYDCWVDQETRLKGDVTTCKDKFLSLANGGNNGDCKSSHSVYFPINSHCLINASGADAVRNFADVAKNSSAKILVVGSTDKSGTAKYNKALSLKRAKAVADELVSYGISKHRIKLVALGESRATSENEPESRNAGLFIEDAEIMKCFNIHGQSCAKHVEHKHTCGAKKKAMVKKHTCGAKKKAAVKKIVAKKKKCNG